MAKMFKLLENELDMLFSCLNGVHKTAESIETIADYILKNDDKKNYKKDEIKLVEDFAQKIFSMRIRIEGEGELIQRMKSEIVDLY